jgi:hypothetical protein
MPANALDILIEGISRGGKPAAQNLPGLSGILARAEFRFVDHRSGIGRLDDQQDNDGTD